jgi:hypothetical protein
MSTRMETRRKHRTLTPTPARPSRTALGRSPAREPVARQRAGFAPSGEGKSVPRLKTLSPRERVAAGRVRVRAYRNACTCGARA